MHALFPFEQADPTINWPKRGSAEKVLCEREGWELRTIPVVMDGVSTTKQAMCQCNGELAVNLMLGNEEGFAICIAKTGWRISCGGRVYARCADAMRVAEAMMQACTWEASQSQGYTDEHKQVLRVLTDEAERRGECMMDRVYPRG